jgi:hypothetical protein
MIPTMNHASYRVSPSCSEGSVEVVSRFASDDSALSHEYPIKETTHGENKENNLNNLFSNKPAHPESNTSTCDQTWCKPVTSLRKRITIVQRGPEYPAQSNTYE